MKKQRLDYIADIASGRVKLCGCFRVGFRKGQSLAKYICSCGQPICDYCGRSYERTDPHYNHTRTRIPFVTRGMVAELIAAARETRLDEDTRFLILTSADDCVSAASKGITKELEALHRLRRRVEELLARTRGDSQ